MKKKIFGLNAADTMMKNESYEAEEKPAKEHPRESNLETENSSKVQTLVEKIDTPINTAFNFRFVDRQKMIFHERNDYPMEAIEKLAELILDYGLIHNIEVTYNLENNQYVVDAGERRTRAIDLLIEKYKNYIDTKDPSYQKYIKYIKPFEKGYPCNVKIPGENLELDEIETEIRLIIANESVREHDPVSVKKHIDRLNELYSMRNSVASKKEKINVNATIAETLGISDRQVKKYNAINKLIPELQEKFDEKKITLTDGANYAMLNEAEQRQILDLIESSSNKDEINELYGQISRMKKEMAEKEAELKRLETEKNNAIETVKESKERTKELREQIKKELEANDPNKGKMEILEQQLREANQALKEQKKSLKNTMAEKEQQLSEMEQKLSEKALPMDNGQIKAEIRLETTIASMRQKIVTIGLACKECQEKEDKIPEQYKNELKDIIKCLERISNNIK